MSASSLPDLTAYSLHRTDPEASFEGVAVPGLSAEFYHRRDGDRIASVGRYRMAGQELLVAWGYVDEEHCRHSAVRNPQGGWHGATAGCPTVRVERDGDTDAVTGLAVRTPGGRWLTYSAEAGAVLAGADARA